MDHIDYRIYRESDLHAVTQMWRESRDGWPPGFFGASDISEASIEQEEKNSGQLFTVIAVSGERVVGYCRTSPYGGEPDAAYVDLLNAVPDMHGHGIGKSLLLDAIGRCTERGLVRLDLHTWSANMKAVPLYKKTGFFWVPDTMVYMQNYIPFLLDRKEFREFAGDSYWYDLFQRELEVEPDLQKAESGRHIYRYLFEKDGEEFVAEFDRQGRSLSLLRCPGFSAALSTDTGSEYFAGRPVTVSLSGKGFSREKVTFSSAGSLPFSRVSEDVVRVVPSAVRVPIPVYDPAERLSAGIGDLELGIGMLTREEVALHRSSFRFLPEGAEAVTLGVRSLGNVRSASVLYSVDGGEQMQKVFAMTEATHQAMTLELPALARGVHSLSVQIGRAGYRETVVLVAGIPGETAASFDVRDGAVVVSGELLMKVNRRGGRTSLYRRDSRGEELLAGSFFLCAGPPSWNSDLPKQEYHLTVSGDAVRACALWPSRPGLEHSFTVRLDPAGYAEVSSSVSNSSDQVQKVAFRARNHFSMALEPKTDLLPVQEGLLAVSRVYNQVPDWDEDLSSSVSGLAAPWHGVTGGGLSVMDHFSGWPVLEYDLPGTEEQEVLPGEKLESPVYRMLCCSGNETELLRRAEALGWQVGDWRTRTRFIQTDLEPVMRSGSTISLTHPLHGERKGSVSLAGDVICSGTVCRGKSISGCLEGEGRTRVTVSMAGRDHVRPVYLVSPSSRVTSSDENGLLELSGERLKVRVDPAAFGQVFSAVLDGREFLLSSRPEPTEFAWEKPWYGGIHPRYMSDDRPFRLAELAPEVEKFTTGLLAGWKMSWVIDHRDHGSVRLVWKAGILPEVPVLVTELECGSLSGLNVPGGLDIRGFLSPGGSVDDVVMTCQEHPSLRQGRNHAGAWAHLGSWGRVQRNGSFVEMISTGDGVPTCDDYAEKGCHLGVYGSHHRNSILKVNWIFGNTLNDSELAEVLRDH